MNDHVKKILIFGTAFIPNELGEDLVCPTCGQLTDKNDVCCECDVDEHERFLGAS